MGGGVVVIVVCVCVLSCLDLAFHKTMLHGVNFFYHNRVLKPTKRR